MHAANMLHVTTCNYAVARVQAFAEVFVEGGCYSAEVSTSIRAETSAQFTVIEGCERDDVSSGDASGSTDGSTAEGQTNENPN